MTAEISESGKKRYSQKDMFLSGNGPVKRQLSHEPSFTQFNLGNTSTVVDGGVSIPISECLGPAQIRYLSFVDCIGLEA
jgi:hypothetical protein